MMDFLPGDKVYYRGSDGLPRGGTFLGQRPGYALISRDINGSGYFYLSSMDIAAQKIVRDYYAGKDDSPFEYNENSNFKLHTFQPNEVILRFRRTKSGVWEKKLNPTSTLDPHTTIDMVMKMLQIQDDKEPDTVKQDKMSQIIASLKADAIKAGYRVGSTQLTNAVKKGIVTVLEKQGESHDNLKAVAFFLDSEIGSAMISVALGVALPQLPEQFSSNPHVEKISEEFRINGMTTVGNTVMSEISGYIMPALNTVFSNLPEVEQEANVSRVRLQESKAPAELEEEETSVAAKVAHAK